MRFGTPNAAEPSQESEGSMLLGKRKSSGKWLAGQVAYGVDTSDPDPKKQKAFGYLAEQLETEKKQTNTDKTAAK